MLKLMRFLQTEIEKLTDNETAQDILLWLANEGLIVLAIMFGAYLARHFSGMIIRKVVSTSIQPDSYATPKDEKQREDTIVSILHAIVRVGIWVVAGLIIVGTLGVDLGALVAGAGALSLAIGFGAQSMISDFVAGVFIIMENQYRVGDVVEINGKSGVVESITIRTTVLRDLDGHQHHVPNGQISNATNMSKDYSNVHLDMGVSYDADIDKVEKVINETGKTMAKTKKWSEMIIDAPAFLRVDSFGDSSVNVKILARVTPGSQWSVAGEYRRRLKKAFEKNKIEIPYPHIVVKK